MYTVKQLSELAGVTIRTLHYYDEISLLNPTVVKANGYRYYDEAAVLRLQQILFYREMGLELLEIKDILDQPDFDVVAALRSHRISLQGKIQRLEDLVQTVDDTIRHLQGEQIMSKKQLFRAFTPEEQKDNERLARLEYGPTLVNESIRRWNSYSKAQQQAILDEGNMIYMDIVAALEAEKSPQSADVQATMERWHEHIHHFYDPTLDVLRGLGETYHTHPGFIANFEKLHPDLPEFLHQAVTQYVDDLEYAEIVQMLAEDEAQSQRG